MAFVQLTYTSLAHTNTFKSLRLVSGIVCFVGLILWLLHSVSLPNISTTVSNDNKGTWQMPHISQKGTYMQCNVCCSVVANQKFLALFFSEQLAKELMQMKYSPCPLPSEISPLQLSGANHFSLTRHQKWMRGLDFTPPVKEHFSNTSTFHPAKDWSQHPVSFSVCLPKIESDFWPVTTNNLWSDRVPYDLERTHRSSIRYVYVHWKEKKEQKHIWEKSYWFEQAFLCPLKLNSKTDDIIEMWVESTVLTSCQRQ